MCNLQQIRTILHVKGCGRFVSDNFQVNMAVVDIYRSFTKVLYICKFCKSIHIPLMVKERASKQFIFNNLAETYILSMCGSIK